MPLCGNGLVISGPIFFKGIVFTFMIIATVVKLLFARYYIDANYAVVRGRPSASLAEKLEKDEKARIAAQVKALGPEGLKKAEQELEEAKAEHEKPIPTDILTAFPVPDVKSISWIPVQSVQECGKGRTARISQAATADLSKYIQADGSPLPFFVQYDHVQVRGHGF